MLDHKAGFSASSFQHILPYLKKASLLTEPVCLQSLCGLTEPLPICKICLQRPFLQSLYLFSEPGSLCRAHECLPSPLSSFCRKASSLLPEVVPASFKSLPLSGKHFSDGRCCACLQTLLIHIPVHICRVCPSCKESLS